MTRTSENKLVLVVRRTRLDDLIVRFNTVDQARFYVEHLGADFSDYLREHEHYKHAVLDAERVLARLGRVQTIERTLVPNFIFGPQDTVVVLGQDGLVANVLKYLDGQPVIGVNPDPARWEGVLLPFFQWDLERIVPEVFGKRRRLQSVTLAQATLNTGETLCGVNDLFIGPRSHTSARYVIEVDGRQEAQSSSGIIVSTGLGSTGWLRSIVAGAKGIAAALAVQAAQEEWEVAQALSAATPSWPTYAWDSDDLYFSVREPWPSKTSAATLAYGKIVPGTPLTVLSQMPEHGVIFSDGIEADYLPFNAGTRATIAIAPTRGYLVM